MVVVFLDGTAHLFEVRDEIGRSKVVSLLGRVIGEVVSKGHLEWIRQIVYVRYLDDLYFKKGVGGNHARQLTKKHIVVYFRKVREAFMYGEVIVLSE